MSSYSRMVVIPQEEYMQLSAVQQVRQPMTQQFYNAEQDYQKNLHVADPQRTVLLQSETIERLKDLKDQMRSYLTISTPRPYRTRAEALFQSIEPHLNVNEKGEIIKDDNTVIESSRYEDLIQHAVRDRRRSFTPTGWSYFVNLLKRYNVPKSSLNRETLDELTSPTPVVTPRTVSPMKRSRATASGKKRTAVKSEPEFSNPFSSSNPFSFPRQTKSRTPSKRRKQIPKRLIFADY